VFVASHAADARAESIADTWAASVFLGGGQFCTKPGVLFVAGERAAARVAHRARELFASAAPAVLLTKAIHEHASAVIATLRARGAQPLAGLAASTTAPSPASRDGFHMPPTLFAVDAAFTRAHRA
jgi:NADP-dependent aldehyde dehydrogenase